MKKLVVCSIVLLCGVALAQVPAPAPVVSPVAPAVGGIAAIWAFLKPYLVAILISNSFLSLANAILGKIPVVGPYLISILDVLMANPAHTTPPPPTP